MLAREGLEWMFELNGSVCLFKLAYMFVDVFVLVCLCACACVCMYVCDSVCVFVSV